MSGTRILARPGTYQHSVLCRERGEHTLMPGQDKTSKPTKSEVAIVLSTG